jgi:hypothetical protein
MTRMRNEKQTWIPRVAHITLGIWRFSYTTASFCFGWFCRVDLQEFAGCWRHLHFGIGAPLCPAALGLSLFACRIFFGHHVYHRQFLSLTEVLDSKSQGCNHNSRTVGRRYDLENWASPGFLWFPTCTPLLALDCVAFHRLFRIWEAHFFDGDTYQPDYYLISASTIRIMNTQ